MSSQNQSQNPSSAPRAPFLVRIFPRLNKRLTLSIIIMVGWLFIWIPLALSMRFDPSTVADESSGSSSYPRTTEQLESVYLYFLPVITTGAAVLLIGAILLRYRNIYSMRRILIPCLIALGAWVVIHWLTVRMFDIPVIVAIVSGVMTLICWAVLTNLPIWTVEMLPGHVYYHHAHIAARDEFEFVTRPLPKIDQRLLTQLMETGIPHESLRIYLTWGAPFFLRDELSDTILNKYYNKLCELNQKHPQYFKTPGFKPDSYDVGFTQSNIQYTFEVYRSGVKKVLAGINASETQDPQMVRVPSFIRDKQQAQSAQQAVESLYAAYKNDVTLLSKLFADSDDRMLIPDPVNWVTAFDSWRLIWNKTKSVRVEVKLDNLVTLENLSFGIQVVCYCTFEPDKVRTPNSRLKLSQMRSETEVEESVRGSVSGFITREAHTFFQVMQSKTALEVGADQFRQRLAEEFNTRAGRGQQISMSAATVDCNLTLHDRILETRLDENIREIQGEHEIIQLKKLLELGGLNPAMQAEAIMRILTLSNLPPNAKIPAEALFSQPPAPTNIVIHTPPAPQQPQLPAGQNANALPAGAGGNRVNVLPTEIDRKDDSQIRKKARLNNLDDTIELRQDPNDPDLYHSQ